MKGAECVVCRTSPAGHLRESVATVAGLPEYYMLAHYYSLLRAYLVMYVVFIILATWLLWQLIQLIC